MCKWKDVEFNDVENEFDEDNYNIIINFKVLKTIFNDFLILFKYLLNDWKECCLNGGKLVLKNSL